MLELNKRFTLNENTSSFLRCENFLFFNGEGEVLYTSDEVYEFRIPSECETSMKNAPASGFWVLSEVEYSNHILYE